MQILYVHRHFDITQYCTTCNSHCELGLPVVIRLGIFTSQLLFFSAFRREKINTDE